MLKSPAFAKPETVSLFNGVGKLKITNKLKITCPITGDEVQVAQNDFPEKMTWGEALRSCNALGSGWRLPTKEELEAMYKQLHEKGQGNFKSGPLWNREASYWSECAVSFGFNNGKTFSHHNENHPFYVRAVRAF